MTRRCLKESAPPPSDSDGDDYTNFKIYKLSEVLSMINVYKHYISEEEKAIIKKLVHQHVVCFALPSIILLPLLKKTLILYDITLKTCFCG